MRAMSNKGLYFPKNSQFGSETCFPEVPCRTHDDNHFSGNGIPSFQSHLYYYNTTKGACLMQKNNNSSALVITKITKSTTGERVLQKLSKSLCNKIGVMYMSSTLRQVHSNLVPINYPPTSTSYAIALYNARQMAKMCCTHY